MRRRIKITGLVLAAFVIAASVGVWWFFKDDAPPEVSLETALESVTDQSRSIGAPESTLPESSVAGSVAAPESTVPETTVSEPTTTSVATGLDGEWVVDTTSGEFDFESATGSFVGFRIEEVLQGIGSTTAVGRTGSVSGTLQIENSILTTAVFAVDMSALTTDNALRDGRVQEALETGEFPAASFTLRDEIDFGDAATTGNPIEATAAGQLTVHGVTRDVDFDIGAQLVDETIVIVGSTDITFSDYGVAVPSSPILVSADDSGVIEFQLLMIQQ